MAFLQGKKGGSVTFGLGSRYLLSLFTVLSKRAGEQGQSLRHLHCCRLPACFLDFFFRATPPVCQLAGSLVGLFQSPLPKGSVAFWERTAQFGLLLLSRSCIG